MCPFGHIDEGATGRHWVGIDPGTSDTVFRREPVQAGAQRQRDGELSGIWRVEIRATLGSDPVGRDTLQARPPI